MGVCPSSLVLQTLELHSDILQGAVDVQVRPYTEGLLTQRALAHPAAVPVPPDAGHAEAVAAGRRHWIGEDVQADGALELLRIQQAA